MKIQKVLHLHLEQKKKNPNLFNEEFLLTEKRDGWWAGIPFKCGKGWQAPISATGRTVPAWKWLEETGTLKKILPELHSDSLLIAEAVIPDTPFHITNGIFNRSIGDCACKDMQFIMHDVLRFTDQGFVFAETAWARWERLQTILQATRKSEYFQQAHLISKETFDESRWLKYFDEIYNQNGEGLVAKKCSGFYEPGKRNASLLKIKAEDTFDLVFEKLYWTVGEKGQDNLNISAKRENGVIVNVRIGKHSDIDLLCAAEAEGCLQNSIIEIKAMCELESGSLREPRFVAVRYDLQK